jgi:TRAP-type mannitol/chloroaromatic compound transport system substrate-binding protein
MAKLGNGNGSATESLTEEQQKRLATALKNASDSMMRADGESEYLRETIKKIAEDLKIPKKMVNQMAKTYHKQNFDEIVAENEQFQKLYKTVVK